MPNWCECDLSVRGNNVLAFLESIRTTNEDGKEEYAILETQYPVPGILDSMGSPTRVAASDEEAEVKNREHNDDTSPPIIFYATQSRLDSLRALYGATNWYDWCITHWGTKWGDCWTKLQDYSDEWAVLTFSTAWSPPLEGLTAVSMRWPELMFTLCYYEQGMGFQGTFKVKAGEVFMDESSDYEGFRGG